MNSYKTIIIFFFFLWFVNHSLAADSTINVVIIVRIPTYAAKIKYIDSQIHQNKGPEKKIKNLIKIKKDTEKQRDTYFGLLSYAFMQYFTASNVYFVPDTLYKNLLEGDTKVFISPSGEIISINLDGKKVMYMIQGKDEYQLLLTDKDHRQQDAPWPYKKGTFLSTFKKLINRESYIIGQVNWFDEEMKKALKSYKIRAQINEIR